MVDELIEMAYGLAASNLRSLRPNGNGSSGHRIPPLSSLNLLLRECMEWFWKSTDSFQRNRDPYPHLGLRALLGPLYCRPPPLADREKGIKMIQGRALRPRRPLVNCRLFDGHSLPADPVFEPFAWLRLSDPITERMDMSA